MASIFVSHASADAALVAEFVDTILRLGSGLDQDDLFFTSAADTGVPDGADLMAHVRRSVGEAGIVIAILTPTFLTRPVCIAEMGAAWAVAEKFFPVLVPGLERSDLDGVLPPMLIRYMNDGAMLDALHDAVSRSTEITVPTTTWGQYRAKWLAIVDALAAEIPVPENVTLAHVNELREELTATRAALSESEVERRELQQKLVEMAAAKDADEVAQILLPTGDIERFEVLRSQAIATLRELNSVVAEAVRLHDQGGIAWPTHDSDQQREIVSAVESGYLRDVDDGQYQANKGFPDISDAVAALDELRQMVACADNAFREWFRAKYRVPPDLALLASLRAIGV